MNPSPPPYMRELEMAYESRRPLRTFFRLQHVSLLQAAGIWVIGFFKHLPLLLWPFLLAEIIRVIEGLPDGVVETGPPADAIWYLVITFAIITVVLFSNIPLHTLYVRSFSRVNRRMEMRLRAALVRRLQHLSMRFHGERESGKLQSKVLRDVEEIVRLGEVYWQMIVIALITALWTFGIVLFQDWRVGLAFVVLTPVAVALIRFFRRAMEGRNKAYRREVETMSQRVTEMIDMVPVTRAHGVEQYEIETLEENLNTVRQRGLNLDSINATFGACSFVAFHLAIVIMMVLTTVMVFQGMLSLDKIALYSGLFQIVTGTISQVTGQAPQLTKSFEAIRSLGEVLECPDFEENQGKEQMEAVRGEIEFREVSFTYPNAESPAVEGFSLSTKPGDCVAFVGESGSGKSTLMQLTIGFLRPQIGDIRYDGLSQAEIDVRTWRRHIAMVPQHTILFSGSIRENITYGLRDFSEEQIWHAVRAAHLSKVIEELPTGLDTRVGENGLKLSGGQRQRLAIARALIRQPQVIILDEATSALDVISEKEVQAAIDNLISGRTTFIVAHRLSTIRQANKIVVMKEGRAVEIGPPEELMAQCGEFARLRELQA